MKYVFTGFLGMALLISPWAYAQELSAKVVVAANNIGSAVDKKIFKTLQNQLEAFINERQWTNDRFEASEKISCNFYLNIEKSPDQNVYQGSLTVQATRPVFNSSIQTILINFKDPSISFKYVQYQPIDFNENRIQGTEALVSNLSATFAFYVYLILGLDYDSFALNGGQPYFQKAMTIVNNAPESTRDISGWKPFESSRNRYWLAENLTSFRLTSAHDLMYTYFRKGLDALYDDEVTGQTTITNTLIGLSEFNSNNKNTAFIDLFIPVRAQEFIAIYKNALAINKKKAIEILPALDPTNAILYKQSIQ